MKKKLLIIFVVNISAFSAILRTIYNSVGKSVFFELIIPLLIFFATNLSTALAVIRIVNNKQNKTTTDKLPNAKEFEKTVD